MIKKTLLAAALTLAAAGCKNDNVGRNTRIDEVAPATSTTPASAATASGEAIGDTHLSGTADTNAPSEPAVEDKSGAGEMMSAAMVLNKLHAINMHEVEAGKMAEKMGGKEAKEFGKRMVKDHTDADKQVMDLAKNKGVALKDMATMMADPAVPQTEKDQMKADMDKMESLKGMKGAEFDKAYLTAMSDGHGKALDFLRMAQAQADDAEVKALTGKLAPVVESHKKMADDSLKKVGTAKTQGRR